MNFKKLRKIVVVFIVVGATSLISLLYLENEVERLDHEKKTEYVSYTEKRVSELRNNLLLKENSLSYLEGFFNSSSHVSFSEFLIFARAINVDRNLVQICWRDTATHKEYYSVASKRRLCERVNLIDLSTIVIDNGRELVSLSAYTVSFNNKQRGKLTVFFDLSEIDALNENYPDSYGEQVFITDKSSNKLANYTVSQPNLEKTTVIKSSMFFLEEIGGLSFVYFSKLYQTSMNSAQLVNILLVCFLLPLTGIFISFYFWSQEKKQDDIKNEVELRTHELSLANKKFEQLTMRFTLAMKASKIGIWDWDLENNILECDEMMYKHYGRSKDKEKRQTQDIWLNSIHPDDMNRVRNEFINSLKNNSKFETEYRIILPNGKTRYLRLLADTFSNNEGLVVRAVGVNWDNTESKELENELLSSNRDLDQFAYIASHDLREPLRGMRNFAQFLIDDYSDKLDEEGKSYLTIIKKLGSRLEGYLDSLLFYSRLGREKLAYKETDLAELIEEVKITYINLSIKGVDIVAEGDLPVIMCDPLKLTKILGNLLQNAIRYNHSENKIIKIKYKNLGNKKHQFWVIDNGIGIKKEHWERVFTIFKRLHPKDEYDQGSGLGLTLASKAVEQHGGELWVDHSVVGEGTSFTFTILEKPE